MYKGGDYMNILFLRKIKEGINKIFSKYLKSTILLNCAFSTNVILLPADLAGG